jgi:hypothetical protein
MHRDLPMRSLRVGKPAECMCKRVATCKGISRIQILGRGMERPKICRENSRVAFTDECSNGGRSGLRYFGR